MLQEDQRLQRVMRELGGTQGAGFSWSAVAKKLGGGRTGKSCRLRYIFLTSASLHCLQLYRATSAHRALTNVIGPFNPARALRLPAFDIVSAHHRWYNQLSPNLKREPFDHQEDVLIIQVSYVHWPMACFVMDFDASGASSGPNPMVYDLADAF